MKDENIVLNMFAQSVQSNLDNYFNAIIDAVAKNKSNYLSVAFMYRLYKYPKIDIDLQHAIDRVLSIKNNGELRIINNKLFFIDNTTVNGISHDEWNRYYERLEAHENMQFETFMQINDKKEVFMSFEYINLLPDVIIKKEKLFPFTHGRPLVIISENWARYCFNIIGHCFSEYSYNKHLSKAGLVLFSKVIDNNTMIALQYDNKRIKKATGSHIVDVPDLDVVLILGKMDAENKGADYEIINLGSAHGLLFYPLATPPDRYLYNKMNRKISHNENTLDSFEKIETLDEDNIRVSFDFPYEEELRFYLYFYFDVYSYYSKIYLNFIESCLNFAILHHPR